MDDFREKMNKLEQDLKTRIDEIEKAFSENSDEDDSQMNESIENVSGEINDEESQKKSQGSHRQPKAKNPDVNVLTVDDDGKVMSPVQSGRNSNLS